MTAKVRKPTARKAPAARVRKRQTPMSGLVVEAAKLAKLRIDLDDAEIVVRLAPLVGQTYTRSVVSNWLNGTARMPADVLLGMVKLAGPRVSLDELLFGESRQREIAELREGLAAVERRLGDLGGRR